MSKKPPEKGYQLHISINGIEPIIWRRFLVTEITTLEKLHKIIQVVMGWEDYHLHMFEIGETSFGEPDPEWGVEIEDEMKIRLADLHLAEGQKFEYIYDFGDNWNHEIKVEKILPFDASVRYPKCLEGKLACPREDCGGIGGHHELFELSQLPEDELDEEGLEQLEWMGDDYDFEFFSVDHVNAALWKRFRS